MWDIFTYSLYSLLCRINFNCEIVFSVYSTSYWWLAMNKPAYQTHMHMLACMHTHLVSSAKEKSLETILLKIVCSLEIFLRHKFWPTFFDHCLLPITMHLFRQKKFQPLYGLHELINFENDTLYLLALLQYSMYRNVFHLRLYVIRSRRDRGQDHIQAD